MMCRYKRTWRNDLTSILPVCGLVARTQPVGDLERAVNNRQLENYPPTYPRPCYPIVFSLAHFENTVSINHARLGECLYGWRPSEEQGELSDVAVVIVAVVDVGKEDGWITSPELLWSTKGSAAVLALL